MQVISLLHVAPATVMGVALSKLLMAIVACICTKEIKVRAPHAFAASKIIVSKSGRGSQSERCSSRHCASISGFLNFMAHVIQSGSDPDNF